MGTAIKHPVPERVKPSFVIFDIRALWRYGYSFIFNIFNTIIYKWEVHRKLKTTCRPGSTRRYGSYRRLLVLQWMQDRWLKYTIDQQQIIGTELSSN